MRTFGLLHFSITLVAGTIAAAVAVTPLHAQERVVPVPTQASTQAPTARVIPARCSGAGCGGDFQLAIVAALYPYYDGVVRGPGVLTLVIENRGTAPAPLSTLDVAPLARFASYSVARHASVDALMPGERTVVEIPLALDANGGAPCISISVTPGIAPTSVQMLRYATSGSPVTPAAEPSFASPPFVSFVGDEY